MSINKNNNKKEKVANINENKNYSKKEKAEFRLDTFEGQAERIIEIFDLVSELFKEILDNDSRFELDSNKKNQAKAEEASNQKVPNRIEFKYMGLNYYIDFTLVSTHGDDLNDIIGSIIYGVNRTQHFADCIFQDTNEKTKPKKTDPEKTNPKVCIKTMKCDRSEDKPIIQFSVNRHGLIKSSGELEDKWWVKEKDNRSKNKESLAELLYRTLGEILNEALDWTNETILP